MEETEDREGIEPGDEREHGAKWLRTLMKLKEMATKRGEVERDNTLQQCIVYSLEPDQYIGRPILSADIHTP